MSEYHKKTISPLYLYNTFNRLYFQYFSGHPVRSAKKISDPDIESYLTWFITSHYPKIKDKLNDYVLWCFQQHGRFRIRMLHRFMDDWDDTKPTGELQTFANKMAKYLRDNYIWNIFVCGTKYFDRE